MTPQTEERFIAISIIPRFTGLFSLVGSSLIIYMILSDREKKLVKSYHRLMLVMSVFDVFQSIALAASTSPFPKETQIYGSIGNKATCQVQYFFLIIGMAVPMYNASLSTYYLLTIRYRFPFRYFETKIEPFLHGASVLIPMSIAIAAIVTEDVTDGGNTSVCLTSYNARTFWGIISMPSLSFCVCLYSMVSISCYANTRSTRVRRYSYSQNQTQRRESERQATIRQAMLYTLAFMMTFIFPVLVIIFPYYPFEVLKNIFYPLQGFWNFVLYIRPIVIKRREAAPHKYFYEIVWSAVFHRNERSDKVKQKQSNNMVKNTLEERIRLANLDLDINESSEESKEGTQIDSQALDVGIIASAEESKQEIFCDSPKRLAAGMSPLSITSEERRTSTNSDDRINESFDETKETISNNSQTNSELSLSPRSMTSDVKYKVAMNTSSYTKIEKKMHNY